MTADSNKPLKNDEKKDLVTVESRERWDRKIEFLFACIGFAVGYGNFWRFPYMCFKNGGGAFLIPYVLFLCLGGIPLFFMELSLGQLLQEGPIKAWQKICPLFSGIGFASIVISFIVSIYYNVILAWSLYFLYNSFFADIPWVGCHHSWNTPDCYVYNASANASGVSSSREFLVKNVLEITKSIEEPGGLSVHLTLCLLVAWILVYFSIWRGIRTTGKVVYVTATLPYIILVIFFIKGVTLPGAIDGVLYFITPQWDRLQDPKVWIDAASQILYSLTIGFGVLIGFASYNPRKNNVFSDALLISVINCATSVFAGFVIFAIVGYMAHVQEKSVPEVASQGPGLVFIVYPAAISQLPFPQIWAVIFFLMLIALGLDSQFGQVEVVAAALIEQWPRQLHKHRELVVLVICFVMFLLGLSCVSKGGMFVFNLFDSFSCGLSLLFVVCFELLVIGWIYGARRYADNISQMIGRPVLQWWVICWKYISPIMVLGIFVFSLAKYKRITYENVPYPAWAEGVGWLLALSSMLCIPVTMCYKIYKAEGTFLQRLTNEAFVTLDDLDLEIEKCSEKAPIQREIVYHFTSNV
ncbi:sodium- and chloride-dependent GABA transporter 1 isoform X2 [Nematostella vectensis]|nr:sodium- and chloride-dependent GABA transporter 1 isoform X2 [Nematostella vectensis]XP_032237153.1 sodium- and chloride-dependent GABA transporter 1 isoform X2 [Nematostella vectensis]XP_048586328.1 sodium- and chloride-dependent GABA transporter 1 isoform X2 [Nematostella vectensis]